MSNILNPITIGSTPTEGIATITTSSGAVFANSVNLNANKILFQLLTNGVLVTLRFDGSVVVLGSGLILSSQNLLYPMIEYRRIVPTGQINAIASATAQLFYQVF